MVTMVNFCCRTSLIVPFFPCESKILLSFLSLIFFLLSSPTLFCFFLYVTFFLSLHHSLWLSFSLSNPHFPLFIFPSFNRMPIRSTSLRPGGLQPEQTQNSICRTKSYARLLQQPFIPLLLYLSIIPSSPTPFPCVPPSSCLWSNSRPLFCAPVFCSEPRGTCSHV